MKRYAPLLACLGGILAIVLLLPRFNARQPYGVSLTRGQAQEIADRAARAAGIPVEKAWSTLTYQGAGPLDEELKNDPARRRRAAADPVLSRFLGGYRVVYYRRGLEKFPPYGDVHVSAQTGEILTARLRLRNEERGANLSEEQLRGRADAAARGLMKPGMPVPKFEDARPNRLRQRTDWVFRYRLSSNVPTGNVVPYLWIYFTGDKLAGSSYINELADGSNFRGDNAGDIAGLFLAYGVMFTLELLLLVMFLKKYHAGEVGVGTATFLFAVTLVLLFSYDAIIASSASEGTGFGSIDAQQTAVVTGLFKALLGDLPLAVLVFLAWAVGESHARERWGERLASFDALLRRDPINATVGRSLLIGVLTAPAIMAAALLTGWIPVAFGMAHPAMGAGAENILYLGGPIAALLTTAADAISMPVVGILFVLALAHRRRALPVGIIVAAILGTIGGIVVAPIDPYLPRVLFGFGGALAAVAIFLAYDLLATSASLFVAGLMMSILPLLSVAEGSLARQLTIALAVPIAAAIAIAVAGILTGRQIVYSYEDLAPHVKRIIERERVKAEIDAANRIQAALLPLDAPSLAGATVSSHYRAATEIGGDYFDFLKLQTGEIGIAFGDVSGHGLTSGIVMAMAKSALLVQVDYDHSPRAVLDVLNEIVIKTAPKRTMMTFFFGVLDARMQMLRFSSAGHLDPYVYRAGNGRLEPLSSWGFPLGVRRREPFREHQVAFSAGDRLVLYSDGLIEAIDDDGNPFGFDRFEQTIVTNGHLSADEIKKALLHAVRKFTRNRPPEDDQTLVVVAFEEMAADALPADRRLMSLDAAETVH